MSDTQAIAEAYEQLLDIIITQGDEDLYDLVVEYKGLSGKSIRISYYDNQKRLYERDNIKFYERKIINELPD